MRPLISIIITVFQRVDFLEAAIESVLSQTIGDFEIIVSDDSNSEEIRSIVHRINSDHVVYNPSVTRKGVARSVAESIQRSHGTYVAILNDDDLWEEQFLERLLTPLLADPCLGASFSDHWKMTQHGAILAKATEANTRRWKRSLLTEGYVKDPIRSAVLDKSVPIVQGTVFRRDIIAPEMITDEVGGAYDYWIACLIAKSGHRLYYVPQRLARCRVHQQMETLRRHSQKHEDELWIVRTMIISKWFQDFSSKLEKDATHFYVLQLQSTALDSTTEKWRANLLNVA